MMGPKNHEDNVCAASMSGLQEDARLARQFSAAQKLVNKIPSGPAKCKMSQRPIVGECYL